MIVEGNDSRVYGPIDSDAFYEVGTFSIDDHIPYIFTATDSNIVLENLQITSLMNVSYPIMYGVSGGTTLIVDSVIKNGYDVSYNADNCTVIHNDRLTSNHSMISWLMIECENFVLGQHYNIQATSSSSTSAFVDHFSPTTLWFKPVSTSYYPGGDLMFNYTISDRLDNVVHEEHAHNITITMFGDSFITFPQIDEEGRCEICEEGLWISPISINNDYQTYTLQMTMDTDELVLGQSNITLNITGCPSSFGLVSGELLCSKCEVGTFNLDDDTTSECRSCDPDQNPRIHCSDGRIRISEGVWMGFDGEKIISSVCPSSFCCNPDDDEHCDYVEDKESLCANNRDSGSLLCGKCIEGYSESMTSANCLQCDKSIHWNHLIHPLVLAAMWTMWFLFANRDSKSSSGCCDCTCWDVVGRTGDIIPYLIYYQQALSQVFSETTYSLWNIGFLGLFNISAQIVATAVAPKGTDWCFINGLDAKVKILLDLLTPFLIFLLMALVYAIPTNWIKIREAVNFKLAALSACLAIIGKVLSTLFQLISCQSVGPHTVHFYFGYEECYGPTYYIALVVLLMITIPPVFAIVLNSVHHRKEEVQEANLEDEDSEDLEQPNEEEQALGLEEQQNEKEQDPNQQNEKEQDPEQANESPNSWVCKLREPYKSNWNSNSRSKLKYWLGEMVPNWECVIYVRRILIAYFAVSASGDANKTMFLCFVVLCTAVHWRVFPFKSDLVNYTEGILLCALNIVIATQILMESSNQTSIAIMMTVMVLLPILWALCCSVWFGITYYSKRSSGVKWFLATQMFNHLLFVSHIKLELT